MSGVIPAPGANSSGSKFKRRSYTPIADINVTPLVDVMLVLLIIFMVTAPLLQVGVPVDLPKTSAQQVGGKSPVLAHDILGIAAHCIGLGHALGQLATLDAAFNHVAHGAQELGKPRAGQRRTTGCIDGNGGVDGDGGHLGPFDATMKPLRWTGMYG